MATSAIITLWYIHRKQKRVKMPLVLGCPQQAKVYNRTSL